MTEISQQWIQAARVAMRHAYAPYSSFKVGAVLVDDNWQMHLGCNVENAAFGPTNCAERTALYRAIADGHKPKSFRAMILMADTTQPITPCGTCRQVLHELCKSDMPVYLLSTNGAQEETTVGQLLPGAFRAEDWRET
jgi:cytidine deaminase